MSKEKDIERLVKRVKAIRFSVIEKEITEKETVKIWSAVGCVIRTHLLLHKDVIIPGIGIFTLNQVQIPIATHPQRYLFNQKPVFLLSSALAFKFRIYRNCGRIEGFRPQVFLNLSMVAARCQIERVKVDICMKDILAFVEQSLAKSGFLDLPFNKLGTLKIRGERFRMYFDQEFLHEIEENDVLLEVVQ